MVLSIEVPPELKISSRTPSSAKWSIHSGEINSPQSFALGNDFCSAIRTFKPLFASRIAQLEPAGPAPTMIAWNLVRSLRIIFRAPSQNQPEGKTATYVKVCQFRLFRHL